jgi:plastocyanin
MPVWAESNGGPLNYIQIDDIIAFIRAPSTQEYTRRTPEFNEPIIGADGKVLTFKGWRDEAFKPDPSATPVPACYKGDAGSATPAPQATLPPDATILEITALNIAFDKKELTAPAGVAFGIHFVNNDPPPVDHDVDIRTTDSTTVLANNATILQGEITYTIGPLEAGTYTFICSVHPIPAMTGTLTVE